MKKLANLCQIVTLRSPLSLPLLDVRDWGDTKEMQLVQSLLSRPDATQHQLVRELYGQHTPAHLEAFWQLRARLQAKLLNHLYFLDHTDARYPVERRYDMALWQMLHQAGVLQSEGEYLMAEQRLRRALLLAEQDDFIHHAVQAARLLRNLYANQRQPAKYQQAVRHYAALSQRLVGEEEAEALHMEVRSAISGTISMRRAFLPRLADIIRRLGELQAQAPSFNIYTYLYRARLIQEEMLGHYPEMLRITQQAADELATGQLNPRRFDVRFNHYYTVYAYLRSRRVEQGLQLAEQYEAAFHKSSNNWFSFQENHTLLAIHAGSYPRARAIIKAALTNPFFHRQRLAARERWQLYEAYVDFLLPAPKAARTATVAQWAMQLPDFNRDKRGYNVSILILQLLYFLRRRNLDEVMTRLERLRKYRQLHLRDEHTVRSRLFLRLLALLSDKDFNPRACAERGQNLLAKLSDTPQPGEAFAQIEVVPYEELWAITLRLLRQGAPLAAKVTKKGDKA